MIMLNTSPRAKLIVSPLTGNAVIFGFAKDIKLKGKEFNNLVTLFYVTYIVFDIPWVVCIKRYGANRILGIALLGWSAATLGTGFVHNYHQALACRLLLGFFEAGLLPCMVFIISTIWNKKQQGKRIAVIYCATTVSGAFGGLFAYGVQQMGHKHGLEAWRWLFIIEGIISFVVGGLCWITMPYSAEKAWFLNKEQAELMLLKKQRDLLYKGEDQFKAKACLGCSHRSTCLPRCVFTIFILITSVGIRNISPNNHPRLRVCEISPPRKSETV